MKGAAQKLFLLFVGIIFSIIVLELVLQLLVAVHVAEKWYGNRAHADADSVYKILCLGESTTDGQYPWQLEEVLNARNPGMKFQVIDKGRRGATTDFILLNLNDYLDKYNPDMVVTMMGINDCWEDLAVFDAAPGPWYTQLRSYKLLRLLKSHMLYKWTGSRQSNLDVEELAKIDSKNEYIKKGNSYRYKKIYSEAERMYKKAIDLNRGEVDGYEGLGWLYLEEKRTKEAEKMFKKAIEMDPGNASAYEGLGLLCWADKRYQEAEQVYKKGIAVNPRSDEIYPALGLLYRDEKKYVEKEEIYKRYLKVIQENEKIENGQKKGIRIRQLINKEIADEEYFSAKTQYNYKQLKKIVLARNIKLVCVQYPTRKVEPLMRLLGTNNTIFVDNKKSFEDAVARDGYGACFVDRFVESFGHCTDKGNRLLAGNIADVIQKNGFAK
jgi:tetratricopeptide (TPR) repeat protein